MVACPCVQSSCFFPSVHFSNKSNLGADNMFPVLAKFRMSFLFGLGLHIVRVSPSNECHIIVYYFVISLFQAFKLRKTND